MNKELLKSIRLLTGYSQIQLAEKVGISHSTISRVEAGLIKLKPKTEREILNVFNEIGISEQEITSLLLILQGRTGKNESQ